MLVKFKKTGGPVHVTISTDSISVAVRWWYEYAYEKDHIPFKGKGQGKMSRPHALGMPDEIDNDTNEWVIALANIGGSKENYAVRVSWHQDNKLLESWEKLGAIKPSGESGPLEDSVWLVGV